MGKSLDGVLIKKAHKQERFTEQQIQDIVACANETTGYSYFVKNFFYIQHIKSNNFSCCPYSFTFSDKKPDYKIDYKKCNYDAEKILNDSKLLAELVLQKGVIKEIKYSKFKKEEYK